jgi:hypothetical protein
MIRTFLVLAVSAWSTPTYSMPTTVRVSDKGVAAIVDGNDDGVPDDNVDCTFRIKLSSTTNTLEIDTTQDMNLPLRACPTGLMTFTGTGSRGDDSSSNFGDANFTNSQIGAKDLPFTVELVDETSTPGDGAPLSLQDPDDEVRAWGEGQSYENPRAIGTLCQAGGPAAKVNVGGLSMLLQLVYRKNAGGTEFLCIPDLPFETVGGQFVMRDAYIPVTPDRHITAAFDGDEENPFLDIDLNRLTPCGGRTMAPTTTEWGLATLAFTLAALGVWALRRRRTFSESIRIS